MRLLLHFISIHSVYILSTLLPLLTIALVFEVETFVSYLYKIVHSWCFATCNAFSERIIAYQHNGALQLYIYLHTESVFAYVTGVNKCQSCITQRIRM